MRLQPILGIILAVFSFIGMLYSKDMIPGVISYMGFLLSIFLILVEPKKSEGSD